MLASWKCKCTLLRQSADRRAMLATCQASKAPLNYNSLMHRLFPVHGSDGAVPAGIGGYGWHIVFPLIVDNASAIPPFLKGCQRAPAGLCLILEVSDEPPLIANASFHHLPGCSIPSSYTTKGASTARGTGLSSQPWCQHALALAPSRTSALATHSTVETSRMHADMSF